MKIKAYIILLVVCAAALNLCGCAQLPTAIREVNSAPGVSKDPAQVAKIYVGGLGKTAVTIKWGYNLASGKPESTKTGGGYYYTDYMFDNIDLHQVCGEANEGSYVLLNATPGTHVLKVRFSCGSENQMKQVDVTRKITLEGGNIYKLHGAGLGLWKWDNKATAKGFFWVPSGLEAPITLMPIIPAGAAAMGGADCFFRTFGFQY